MVISVLIPTWQRPTNLVRCLEGLARQDRPADEIIVIAREEDRPTSAVLAEQEGEIRVVTVDEPGHVQALNRGLDVASGDVVAITDDDAVPRHDWLARIEGHFEADPSIGGVGGRDWVHGPSGRDERRRRTVGKLQWFGRVIGNHHLGVGPPRDVDLLKGVNMSFRMDAVQTVRFDRRLRGRQLFNDASFSLAVLGSGWRLVYDPSVAVGHYPAVAQDDPRSGSLPPSALADAVHNETLSLLELMPKRRRLPYLLWAALVGTGSAPGLLQAMRLALRRGSAATQLGASLKGRLAGWRTWRAGVRDRSAAPRPSDDPEVTIIANNVGGIGGMELQLARLIGGLLDHGHSITVISWTCALAEHPRLRWVRVRGPRRPFALAYPWFLLLGALLARRHRRGLVHVNGAIFAGRVDLTTVHFCHRSFQANGVSRAQRKSVWYIANSRVSGALSLLGERWCYRPDRTSRLVAVSDGLARELNEGFPSMRDRIEVISNGVDAERFAFDQDAGRQVRANLSIPEDAHVAAFVGSDWERKGLRFALEGVAQTAAWHLLVVGEGDEQRFVAKARQLGIADRVHFVGSQADVVPFYSAASAFLLPTAYETFSLVAYEAAAVGLPILATRVSGIEEIVEPGMSGWFVDRSSRSVAEHLEALADDPEHAARMGDGARERARMYDWTSIVAAYRDLYRSLDRRHGSPDHLTRVTMAR